MTTQSRPGVARRVEEDRGGARGASRWRAISANLGLGFFSFALALALAEGMVRVFSPQQLILIRPDMWQPVDTLGWTHRENVRTTINTGERTVRFITDEHGHRVGVGERQRAERRILLLGDSFMEALQVEYEASFAGLLESRLFERLGIRVGVRNTAVGAWDPPHYLLQARRSLARETFDLVIVAVYLGNDIVTWRSEGITPRRPVEVHRLRMPQALNWSELIDAVLYPVNDFLEVRSHLFILLKKQCRSLLVRAGLTAEYVPANLLRSNADSEAWQVTAGILHDIAVLARDQGTPALFVLLPASFQVQARDFERAVRDFDIDVTELDLEQPNRLLSEALRTRGLTFVDLLTDFRQEAALGGSLYGRVDPHFSPQGHTVMVRVVEPVVADYLEDPWPDVRIAVDREDEAEATLRANASREAAAEMRATQ